MKKNNVGMEHLTKALTNRRKLLVTGAAAGLLTSCGTLPPRIGREDRRPLEGGIGGTGIVGLVTDFGSLIVNGLRIETDRRTQFSNSTGSVYEAAVGLGDSLTIEAETRQGRLIARRVHINHPLVGRIQAIAGDGALLMVNGVQVLVEPQARGRVFPGDRVRISGVWRANQVIASQIILTDDPVDVIAGEVAVRSNQRAIGTIPIRTGPLGTGLEDAEFATILGQFNGTAFNANHITPNRFTGAAGPLKRLSIDGYLDPAQTAPGYKLAGLGHSFATNLKLDRFQNTRTLFDGPYKEKFKADRGMILPENYDQRRALLQTRLDGDDPENWSPTT